MNKNISYSLFGNDLKYYIGAEKNIILNKELLPDWNTVIYYHSDHILNGYVEKLHNLGSILIDVKSFVIGGKDSIHFPYFWRYFTFLNEGVHLSRDLDSRISNREVEYIRRWEQSLCNFFIIRDHPWHAPVPSGLFGIRGKDKNFEIHLHDYIEKSELEWGADQDVLYQYIQNITSSEIFYCGYDRPETYIVRDNENFFIGMQINENDNPIHPSATLSLEFLKELKL